MSRIVYIDCETTGLSALVHRLVCIGMKVEETEYAFMNLDESLLLKEFFEKIESGDIFVGFNVSFDVGFLVLRALRYGINPRKMLGESIDLMENVIRFTKTKYASLKRIAQFFGLEAKQDTGPFVPEMWEAKEYDKIKSYCMSDVRITEQLFEKLKLILFESATVPQRDYMTNLGIKFDESTTKTEASKLIDAKLKEKKG